MESINNGGLNTVELKRDIYKRLLEWKRENTHKVLELEGARQVGKTFILDKFAKENYKVQIYVNMAQTSVGIFSLSRTGNGMAAWNETQRTSDP